MRADETPAGGRGLENSVCGRVRSDSTPRVAFTPVGVSLSVQMNDIAIEAFKAGWHARDTEVRSLEHECSRLWLCAFSDAERRDFLLDRLDRIATMTDPDAELDEVFAAYCESLVNVRREVSADA